MATKAANASAVDRAVTGEDKEAGEDRVAVEGMDSSTTREVVADSAEGDRTKMPQPMQ